MSQPERREPHLGNNLFGETRCMRMKENGPCFRPGKWHVIWNEEMALASTACDEDAEYIRVGLIYHELHPQVPACTDIMARWYPDERTCRIPVSSADAAAGRIIVDR